MIFYPKVLCEEVTIEFKTLIKIEYLLKNEILCEEVGENLHP